MNKFYCNVCEEEVVLQDGKCPKCKTNWEKVIDDSQKEVDKKEDSYVGPIIGKDDNYYQEEIHDYTKIRESDINSNINFFLTWASIGKIIMFVLALLIAIIAFILLESSEGYSLILLIISLFLCFYALVLENTLKWKAYMLHTNKKNKK